MSAHRPRTVRALALGSLPGLLATAVVLAFTLAAAERPSLFFDRISILFVVGGTLTVTVAAVGVDEIRVLAKLLPRALLPPSASDTAGLVAELVRIARMTRREGLLSVEPTLASLAHLPVLQRGLSLLLEGRDLGAVGRLLDQEVDRHLELFRRAETVLRQAAEVAPALGLLGTLVGLVRMLSVLETPEQIGPGMAVALLTTFYGAILGHLLFAPLAESLVRAREREERLLRLQAETALSIGRREHPQLLAGAVATLLPLETDPEAALGATES